MVDAYMRWRHVQSPFVLQQIVTCSSSHFFRSNTANPRPDFLLFILKGLLPFSRRNVNGFLGQNLVLAPR